MIWRIAKKFMAGSARVVGALLGSLIGLVILALVAVWVRPQLVVNRSTLRLAAALLAKGGIEVTWSDVSISADSPAALQKRLHFAFVGLCVLEKTEHAYRSCFDRVEVSAAGGLSGIKPKVTEIGPVWVENGKARIDLDALAKVSSRKPPSKKPATSKSFRFEDVFPSFVKRAKVFPISIEFADVKVLQGSNKGPKATKTIEGNLSFNEKPGADGTGVRIDFAAQGKTREVKKEKYSVALQLVNDKDFWHWNHWTVNGNAHALMPDQRTAELELKIVPRVVVAAPSEEGRSKVTGLKKWLQARRRARKQDSEEAVALSFSVSGNTLKGNQLATARVDGKYDPNKLEAKISGSGRNLTPAVDRITIDDCGLSLERTGTKNDSRYRMDCSLTSSIPIPPKTLAFFEIPAEAAARITADLQSSEFFPSDASQLEGSIDAIMTPILSPLLQGRAELHSKLAGKVGEFPGRGQMNTQLGIELKIPDFQKLNQRLSRTNWGIPAPFQALEGDVTFHAGGSTTLEQGMFPLQLQTRLKSASQNMNLDAGGSLELGDIRKDPYEQLNFVLTLSDLKILLPRLKLEKPPRFTPDSRIHSFAEAEAKLKEKEKKAGQQAGQQNDSSFGYRGVIKTNPDHPVQIVTNLAKAPIPIQLDLSLADDSPLSGAVDIGSFPVEAFNKKANVEHFNIDLKPDSGTSPVDGRVEVRVGDYQVHIGVVGTLEKPQVKVTSDPPVGEDQLVAALLFNRSPEELDANESAAVGSTRATISQGALSLASLFLLASTPIESLNYNPDTGAVTAQVRISEGLSLNVGSGENQEGEVGLRKRLGSNFFVTTDLNNLIQNSNTVQNQTGAVSAYLEWRKRY